MSHLRTATRSLRYIATAGTLLAAAGCSGSSSGAGSKGDVTSDGEFRLAITADPGNLNPLGSNATGLQQLAAFLYDPLVNEVDGEVVPGLASSWKESGRTVKFTLRSDVTCSGGEPLTAADVVGTITYVSDPANSSPLAGATVPVGTTAEAGPDGTVAITTPDRFGFLLNGLAGIPILCGDAVEDPASLTATASGTGPYTLAKVVAGSTYTLERREDYAWGPGDVTGTTAGLPKTVSVEVVPNETTATNLLLSDDLDAATVAGADRSRLEQAGLEADAAEFVFGELEYNQAAGRPTADREVRVGLTQALDLAALRKVATSGTGSEPTRLSGSSPCGDGDVADALPPQDVEAAKGALTGLEGQELTLAYLSKLGPAAAAAADLAVQQWKAVGVDVTARGLTDAQLFKVAYETGDFDIVWIPIDGQNPAQVAPSFSGPTPAEGGGNFAHIDNETYADLATKAVTLPADQACPIWAEAEASLVGDADVVPFANSDYPIWAGRNTTFDVNYYGIVPTTIRMYK
jgi:peptide/nickel transport system substrate-binding protein